VLSTHASEARLLADGYSGRRQEDDAEQNEAAFETRLGLGDEGVAVAEETRWRLPDRETRSTCSQRGRRPTCSGVLGGGARDLQSR
jgi:hypothetical protein